MFYILMLMVLIFNILVSGADGFPHLNWKKCFTNIYFCLTEGKPGKAHVGEILLDVVIAGDHFDMDIQMEEGNFTLWMCLCNQHNNSVLCVKHIFLSLNYVSCVVSCTSEIYPRR